MPQHTRAEIYAQATGMQGLVRACAASSGACKVETIPGDEEVPGEGALPKTTVRWDWLRNALHDAEHASSGDREKAMRTSADRLKEIAQEFGDPAQAGETNEFSQARGMADRILARPEFGAVAPPGPWERFKAKVAGWLGRLFAGIGTLGARAPWLSTLFEWLFFGGAAVGLLLFVWRNFQRQRLKTDLRGADAAWTAWDREAMDWAALAEKAAAADEWREAVHCLYWAAIVRLEGKRLWRHNPARTPREYVRLLKPGTVQRESLGGLTGLLERLWYGLRPAAAEDYQRARSWFERLNEVGAVGARTGGERP